jgi:16S rRNA (cytosine967-C5)-methyltransferase
MNAREAAYLAVSASMKHERFVSQSLEEWNRREHPSSLDYAFALELASGTVRMALSLDHIAAGFSTNNKINVKLKERALVRMAVYQYCYMDKVPLYAIVNESIVLAKKYCYKTFAGFLNALLRKMGESSPSLPSGETPEDISILYSYPRYFVERLVKAYGDDVARDILSAGNAPSRTMVRVRPGVDISNEAFKFLNPITEGGMPVAVLSKAASLAAIASMPEVYIQNATPVALVAELAQRTGKPNSILDLCASPGGKLLAAHDMFPAAALYANDVSEEKMVRLAENLKKYAVEAKLSIGPGERYELDGRTFDLIILDVPCSNSGVLNKRPEARWRLSEEAVAQLEIKQRSLIAHAAKLLAPGGTIWYLTCSILKEENEVMIKEESALHGLVMEYAKTVLPNKEGWDGGFAALLRKRS